MSTSQPKLALLDNTVLSNFAEVKRTEIVLTLWADCTTTPDAWQEFLSGVATGRLPGDAWDLLPITELTGPELKLARKLASALGPGERSCIAVAIKRGGLFVTDDRKARQVALDLGLKVTGTLGILVIAVERNIVNLDDANKILLEMIQNGYRSPVNNLTSLLS